MVPQRSSGDIPPQPDPFPIGNPFESCPAGRGESPINFSLSFFTFSLFTDEVRARSNFHFHFSLTSCVRWGECMPFNSPPWRWGNSAGLSTPWSTWPPAPMPPTPSIWLLLGSWCSSLSSLFLCIFNCQGKVKQFWDCLGIFPNMGWVFPIPKIFYFCLV